MFLPWALRAEPDGRSFGSTRAKGHSIETARRGIALNIRTEHAIDKPVRPGRVTQTAAMIITGLVAIIWMYFGWLYLTHDPGEWRIASQHLGYPLYIIPLIGVTHILGGLGLLIPKVPRLTEWVYAGLVADLVLAFYSQLNSGASTWGTFDPILVTAFVFASYVLRSRMRANRWSIGRTPPAGCCDSTVRNPRGSSPSS